MEQVLTLVCKLQPTPEQAQHLDETLSRFADACAYIHHTLPANIRNKDRMQAMLYYEVRSRFQLSANLAIQAIRRVAMHRKAAHATQSAVETFAPTSIQYDARIFSCREHDWTVSLTLLHGRARMHLHLGHYQRGKLQGQQPKAAQVCKYADGTYAVHIQLHIPITSSPPTDKAIGVDLGRRDIAHTSTGQSWVGDDITQVRDRYSHLRAALQRKASKGTRAPAPQERRVPDGAAVSFWHGYRGVRDGFSGTPTTSSVRPLSRRLLSTRPCWSWKICRACVRGPIPNHARGWNAAEAIAGRSTNCGSLCSTKPPWLRSCWCCVRQPIPPRCAMPVCISGTVTTNALPAPTSAVAGAVMWTTMPQRTSQYWGFL